MSSVSNKKKVVDNQKFYTLAAAAYSALEDIQEDESRFNQFLHYAFDGYREFAMDQSHEVITEEIEMKPWKQIDFPTNMVDWTKIGFKSGDFIKILVNDNNIPKNFDRINNVKQENKPSPDIDFLPITQEMLPFFGFGGSVNYGEDRIYGYGSTYNYLGYFDVDMTNRVINFKETVKANTKVYIEYITDGLNYSGHTLINPYAFRLIKLFIHWSRKLYDEKYGEGERYAAQRLYENQKATVDERMLNLSIQTIREILRSGYTLVPQN